MSLKTECRTALEQLRKEYGIVFGAKDSREAEWPKNHRKVFEAIQELGQIEYERYAVKENIGTPIDPWKLQAKQLATQLVGNAENCIRRNEATWRFACEPLVFKRLNREVACPNCRKRIWRSEIEAKPVSDGRGAEQLQSRQRNREPCRCPPAERPQDMDESVGISKIFIHREQDLVIHESELSKKLPKDDRPDCVYGLRQTRNFERWLHAPIGEGKLVLDLVQSSSFSEDGCPLLFPFLVVEAKSSISPNDWHSIKLQTAFPIRTILEVQHGLKLATGERSKWQAEPLIWFLMNRGEDWIVCAAFQGKGADSQCLGTSHETYIIELWKGCITSRNGALQLFLIVDYIFDWARDVYRPAILNELRILASPDTTDIETAFTDTDIYSSREAYSTIEALEHNIEGQDEDQIARSTLLAFRALDSPNGIVRHAAFIESRFCALFITRDNIRTLIESTKENIVEHLSRRILTQLQQRSLLLGADQLDVIEQQWTGTKRVSRPFNVGRTKFYTVVTILSYMTVCWEQVRELSIIAVAEDAFDALVDCTNLQLKRKTQKPNVSEVDQDLTVAMISHLKDGSTRHNLQAAISRIALRIECFNSSKTQSLHLCDDDGSTRELVQFVYKSFKKGRLEPTEPFLRMSSQMEQQPYACLDKGPFKFRETLNVSYTRAVLIHGEGHSYEAKRKQQSSLCIYLVGKSLEAPDKNELADIIKDTLGDYDVYHTTRNNGNLSLRQSKEGKTPWNIKRSYGFHFPCGDHSFSKWLQSLNVNPPASPGSRRDGLDGRLLLNREWSPWQDPRRISGDPSPEMKENYIQKLIAHEYKHWRRVSRDRRSDSDIKHCLCCAKALGSCDLTSHTTTCRDCDKEITNPKNLSWYGDELKKGLRSRSFRSAGESDSEETDPEECYVEFDARTLQQSPSKELTREKDSLATENSKNDSEIEESGDSHKPINFIHSKSSNRIPTIDGGNSFIERLSRLTPFSLLGKRNAQSDEEQTRSKHARTSDTSDTSSVIG